jgi:hypothetical protein
VTQNIKLIFLHTGGDFQFGKEGTFEEAYQVICRCSGWNNSASREKYPWQVVELKLGLQVWFWSLTPATTSNESKTWKSHSFVCYLSYKLVAFFQYQILSLPLMMHLMSSR